MCRKGGRRCPCQFDRRHQRIASARQRLSRHARAIDAAHDRGADQATTDHAEHLFETALADVEHRTGTSLSAPPEPPPTRAGEFTDEKTRDWTDDDLAAAMNDCWDDQQALDAIAGICDRRDRETHETNGTQQQSDQLSEHPTGQNQLAAERNQTDPIAKPGSRPARRVTPEQQARIDYETMREAWFSQAENDCSGHLLNQRGIEAGVDPRSLWMGPVKHARKYASPELEGWWDQHGRTTWQAFRGQALGRSSDQDQVETVRIGEAFTDAVPI